MISVVYTLNLLLLLSCWLDQRSPKPDQRVALVLLRIILFIPLLALVAGLGHFSTDNDWIPTLFLSENTLSLFMLLLAFRLQLIFTPDTALAQPGRWGIRILAALVMATGLRWWWQTPVFEKNAGMLAIPHYGQLYFSALFTLLAVLTLAWRLETFWRMLSSRDRRQYAYLVLGFFLVIGSLVWTASYRLTYLRLSSEHLFLLALLLITAWLLILYAVTRHRLLNRRIFISRKVVYSALVPTVFAFYLIALGLTSLLIRTLGWTLPFVLQWLLIILGLMAIIVIGLFQKVRGKIKYFISTHFYLNKYEYRDEWLAFSKLLQGAVSEKMVVEALEQILLESLYTHTIRIWLGDREHGFYLFGPEKSPSGQMDRDIPADDPLIHYLAKNPCLYVEVPNEAPATQTLVAQKKSFFKIHGIVLMTALITSDQYLGIIGLGPEYTGGHYGHDDFDLLAALGSQAASALLAARNAETLAHLREKSAWQTLSAFVMHDIKNAATMLGLVQQNAPRHIHDPEFQQDMLASIDDALKRMNKVQARLKTLRGEITPVLELVALSRFLEDCRNRFSKKIPGLVLNVTCPSFLQLQTDREFLYQIMENLLLNTWEAGGAGHATLMVEAASESQIRLDLADSGPGIAPEMLPDRLFEPFATSKPKGSGIGLWQVKMLVEILGGSICARNRPEGGACFSITLPFS
ncbi:MAG: ATP-binding protein [Desulfobacteraceae bacterium]|nr:ATP-binding protein [Desulfobacteraceae bacterium]